MNKKLEEIKNSRLKFKQFLLIWNLLLPISSLVLILLTLYLGYWYLLLTYFLYAYFEMILNGGSKTPNKHRNNFMFNIFKEYFDMKIIKTGDIPATKNYIFTYHPHGIAPFGMYIGLNSNCCGFDDLFPGINLNFKGHWSFMMLPLLREFCLYFGGQYVSKESIVDTLSKPNSSVAINVGGGAEMIFAVPNTAKLIIKNRFGFIRIALETGSDLVPVYAFGENEAFNQSPVDLNSPYFWIRQRLYKHASFFLPIISGRGVLPNTKGIFPNSVPIRIVVGKPINVQKNTNPSEEKIIALHTKYCEELEALYNKYKDEFWYDSSTSPPKLELVENPLK